MSKPSRRYQSLAIASLEMLSSDGGFMKQKSLMYIRILDRSGAILYEGLPAGLPFPEEVILRKCLLYFNDPEPCYIHRGAVILRLAAEMQQALETAPLFPAQSPWADCFQAFDGAYLVEGFFP